MNNVFKEIKEWFKPYKGQCNLTIYNNLGEDEPFLEIEVLDENSELFTILFKDLNLLELGYYHLEEMKLKYKKLIDLEKKLEIYHSIEGAGVVYFYNEE